MASDRGDEAVEGAPRGRLPPVAPAHCETLDDASGTDARADAGDATEHRSEPGDKAVKWPESGGGAGQQTEPRGGPDGPPDAGSRTGDGPGEAVERSAKDRPTVWILVLALSVGGAERTIVDLVNGLDRDRYDVTIWSVFDTNPLAADLADDVPIETLGVTATHGDERYEITGAANPIQYALAPLAFLRAVRRHRPDVLHSFLVYDNFTARIAGLVSSETTVITGERGFHNSSRRLVKAADRATIGLSDVVVSNSRSGAHYYADRGVDRESLRVVPNGRDLSTYRDASGEGLRDELDVPPDAPLVGTVGRLVERKGHYDLLRAWTTVVERVPDAHLVVVGHGPECDGLDTAARTLGVDERVRLTGAREDVPALLDVFDVFAFPSHWEGLPGALQEAMAAGLPIVATEIDGTDELVTHGETALLVPPHDPTALAVAIQQVLADRGVATALGERARSVAFERYTREAMVERFQRLYAEVAGREAGTDAAPTAEGEGDNGRGADGKGWPEVLRT